MKEKQIWSVEFYRNNKHSDINSKVFITISSGKTIRKKLDKYVDSYNKCEEDKEMKITGYDANFIKIQGDDEQWKN